MDNNNKNLFSVILSISLATIIVAGIMFAYNIYTSSDSYLAKALTKLFYRPTSLGGPNEENTSATSANTNQGTLAQGASSTNATSPQVLSSHLLTYQNPAAGFRLEYPPYWQKSENATSNTSAVFFSEPLAGVRFTVANFKIPQTILLNEPKNIILTIYLNGFTQPLQPYISTQSTSSTVAGNPVNKTELAYFYAGHPARITILSSLIGDKVYILSYAATKENYALFLPTAQQMIDSFSILPAAVTSTSATFTNHTNQQVTPSINKANNTATSTTTSPTVNKSLTNQTAVPRSNAITRTTAATILVNVDACNPKSQDPLSPKSVTVQVGGMVNWTNRDKLSHEFISGTPNALTNLFDSGLIDPGKSAGVTFKKLGTFSYFDGICSNLNGTISVLQLPNTPQQAVTPGSINSTTLPRHLIISPSQLSNATVHAQANATSKPLPQSLPRIQTQQLPQLLRQQAYNQGFNSKGMVNSLINTPTATWIATGNWIMNVDNGTVTFFGTNMTWYNNNGATSHTHEFQNFKVTLPAKIISFPNGTNSISFKGIMDVGTNHHIVWKNVPTTININGEKTITISVADNATNHHFAGQPIFGLVSSFVPCSDIPGPNMQVSPPCTSEH